MALCITAVPWLYCGKKSTFVIINGKQTDLPVATSNDLCVWTFRSRFFEQPLSFIDGNVVRVLREEVRCQIRDIGRPNALASNVPRSLGFQATTNCWADGYTLYSMSINCKGDKQWTPLTISPGS